ncbi:MAG: fluoride efflux transporter FluC [Gemmatimonadales bacterium]
MTNALLVGAGGFLGSVARYAASGLVTASSPPPASRGATLTANVAGCLAIGLLGGLGETRQIIGHDARLFLLIGRWASCTV